MSTARRFAVWSASADSVVLCLPSPEGEERVPMERHGDLWEAETEAPAGTHYGFRADGPRTGGHRFDPDVLLLDPRAAAIDETPEGYRSVVVDTDFDWSGDRRPATPWRDTLIYEAHVKGLTMLHPEISEALRGTYAGLASGPILDHLTRLGITAIELLPIHQSAPERHLLAKNLTNYWGYSTIGYFAPHAAYSAASEASARIREVKEMVRALHSAGIEVILDVVYNHTAEEGPDGPTYMLRGLGDLEYYRHAADSPERYDDVTGCGNTLDTSREPARSLVLDSLRYWADEFHVDGFRFDLATTLGRGEGAGFSSDAAFLDAVLADPLLSRLKLIAEPWDVGWGGYNLGGFPAPFAEWNGAYRDDVRDMWRGGGGGVSRLATRLAGSSDLFGHPSRSPQASINFVTCHDGFTLADLCSYAHKHNDANGEQGRDGTDDNRSQNFGIEGPSDDPAVAAARWRQQRNLLATLVLSQGVPMLLAGDEFGRTQGGNNNAYCQDNPISWINWDLRPEAEAHIEVVRRLLALRAELPELRRERFFDTSNSDEVRWFREDGVPMEPGDWSDQGRKSLGMQLGPVAVLVNLGLEEVAFHLGKSCTRLLQTSTLDTGGGETDLVEVVPGYSVTVVRNSESDRHDRSVSRATADPGGRYSKKRHVCAGFWHSWPRSVLIFTQSA